MLQITIEPPDTQLITTSHDYAYQVVSHKGNLFVKRQLIWHAYGGKYPAQVFMAIQDIVFEDNQLTELLLIPTENSRQANQFKLVKYRHGWFLPLKGIDALKSLNFYYYEYTFHEEIVAISEKTKAIRLRLIQTRIRPEYNSSSLQTVPLAVITPRSVVNRRNRAQTSSKSIAQIMKEFFIWKATQHQQVDGQKFETELAHICRELIDTLFYRAVPPSLPYKQGPSVHFFEQLAKTKK
jgi:hypothetical protein